MQNSPLIQRVLKEKHSELAFYIENLKHFIAEKQQDVQNAQLVLAEYKGLMDSLESACAEYSELSALIESV